MPSVQIIRWRLNLLLLLLQLVNLRYLQRWNWFLSWASRKSMILLLYLFQWLLPIYPAFLLLTAHVIILILSDRHNSIILIPRCGLTLLIKPNLMHKLFSILSWAAPCSFSLLLLLLVLLFKVMIKWTLNVLLPHARLLRLGSLLMLRLLLIWNVLIVFCLLPADDQLIQIERRLFERGRSVGLVSEEEGHHAEEQVQKFTLFSEKFKTGVTRVEKKEEGVDW